MTTAIETAKQQQQRRKNAKEGVGRRGGGAANKNQTNKYKKRDDADCITEAECGLCSPR